MVGSPVNDSSVNGSYELTLGNERAFGTSDALCMPLLIKAILWDALVERETLYL